MFDQTATNNFSQGGFQYNGYQPQQMPKVMNVLTDEEIKTLQQSTSEFRLGLTQRETLQAACNHRIADGTRDSLTFDQSTGIARCTICGYEFKPIDADTTPESIQDSCDRIVDILQTIKIMFTELPAASAREYFQIIPLIGKIPELFKFAAKNFAKHEFNAWSYSNHNMGGAAMFQNLSNMFGASMNNGGMNMGFQQQYNPYAQQPGAPVGYPNPVMNQPMMGGNAFGYPGASQPAMNGYAPATQGFQYTPNAAPSVTAPAAAPAVVDATDTVTQKVNV